ncbi:hypothetical protein QMT40_000990 [Parvibaculaceae bacterium PLY_AMNH_Bact1]|nr:hypothetical protein QMT40_000990 [Parvibaculaceae bacterium PLY_AMNH_Bact1]
MDEERAPGRWHLDKRVPIALIVAILIQTAGALTWAGAASERINHLEREVISDDDMGERTARLEVQAAYMRAALTRIEDKLDRAIAKE